MKDRPWTGCVRRSTTHTSPSGVDSTRGTRSARCGGASRSHRSGGGFTWESAEMSLSATPGGYHALARGDKAGSAARFSGPPFSGPRATVVEEARPAMQRVFARPKLAQSALLASLLFASRAAGAPTYVVTDLGTLGGATSVAWAINRLGEVVGSAATATGSQHAFIFRGGAMIDLGTLGGTTSFGYGINRAGDVVGAAYDASAGSRAHAFLYRGGMMVDLGTLGGQSSSARAINDSGEVLGVAADATNTQHAFL